MFAFFCINPTDKTDMVWQYNDNNGLIIKKNPHIIKLWRKTLKLKYTEGNIVNKNDIQM